MDTTPAVPDGASAPSHVRRVPSWALVTAVAATGVAATPLARWLLAGQLGWIPGSHAIGWAAGLAGLSFWWATAEWRAGRRLWPGLVAGAGQALAGMLTAAAWDGTTWGAVGRALPAAVVGAAVFGEPAWARWRRRAPPRPSALGPFVAGLAGATLVVSAAARIPAVGLPREATAVLAAAIAATLPACVLVAAARRLVTWAGSRRADV